MNVLPPIQKFERNFIKDSKSIFNLLANAYKGSQMPNKDNCQLNDMQTNHLSACNVCFSRDVQDFTLIKLYHYFEGFNKMYIGLKYK